MEMKQRFMMAYVLEDTRCSDNLIVATVISDLYILGKNYNYNYICSIQCFRPLQSIRHHELTLPVMPLQHAATMPPHVRLQPSFPLTRFKNYTGMWLLLDKGTRATPQPCLAHCPAIASLTLAITHFHRHRGSSCTQHFETKPSDQGVADDDGDGGSDRSISCRLAKHRV